MSFLAPRRQHGAVRREVREFMLFHTVLLLLLPQVLRVLRALILQRLQSRSLTNLRIEIRQALALVQANHLNYRLVQVQV